MCLTYAPLHALHIRTIATASNYATELGLSFPQGTPLLAKLAVAAGRVVGLYGVVQQRRYADANSLASEALSQAHTVAAHAAGDAVLRDYEGRVAAYQEVIGATLLTETILRFTRLLLDQLTSFLLLAASSRTRASPSTLAGSIA